VDLASADTSTYSSGLSTQDAERLLAQYGPNSIAEVREHRLGVLLGKFWAPVPWMLEAAVLLDPAPRTIGWGGPGPHGLGGRVA
jgi:H+-transporting ATPase